MGTLVCLRQQFDVLQEVPQRMDFLDQLFSGCRRNLRSSQDVVPRRGRRRSCWRVGNLDWTP